MPKVIVVETSSDAADKLRDVLKGISDAQTVVASSVEAGAAVGQDDEARVLLIGPSVSLNGALASIEALPDDAGLEVVMVVASPDTAFMRRSMRAGVHDVIPLDAPVEEVVEAVRRAMAEAEVARDGAAGRAQRGSVVTIFSTKGGVGKTVLSTNVAVRLASSGERTVALIDLDLQFGDVGIMLGLTPNHTIYDAAQAYDRLDEVMLRGVMTKHPSGLDVLLAPARPEEADAITAQRVNSLIELLRSMYDIVVVDTAPAFTDVTLTILDSSDVIYVVTMMDVASIKNTRVSMQKLQQLGYDPKILRLVLNRADSKVLLNVSDVERTIGGASGHIPSDLLVPRSVNKGVPVVIDAPRSRVARSIAALASDALVQLGKEVKSGVS
jgi:pilus assembly protein CpaE